jgi:hypothetical protein
VKRGPSACHLSHTPKFRQAKPKVSLRRGANSSRGRPGWGGTYPSQCAAHLWCCHSDHRLLAAKVRGSVLHHRHLVDVLRLGHPGNGMSKQTGRQRLT